MKKKISLFLLAFVPLVLSGCGEGSVDVEPSDNFDVTGVHVVSSKELFLTRGERASVEADVSVKNEEVNKSLIWVSSDNNIATVDSNGIITAGSTTGQCTISAISVVGGYSDSVVVHVGGGSKEEITDLTLSITSYTFNGLDSDPIEIIPTINPSTISIDNISYTNSDEKVAKFEKTENGIKVGIYFYSYATSPEEGIKQANYIIDHIKDYDVTMPIAFDWESWAGITNAKVSLKDLWESYDVFNGAFKAVGFDTCLYQSKNYLANGCWNNLDKTTVWLAQYYKEPTYDGEFFMWQCSNTGVVPGIQGDCDIDVRYK